MPRPDSFHVAGEQIATTLHDAHLALEAYADGEAGPRGLKQCADLLHAARGALQLLEVYGASLLAEEMESTCQFLVDANRDPSELSDEGVEALSRAMVQLPAYIDRIMGGGRDIPLVLLPLLNDLRAARGKPLLSESTLLLLNLEPGQQGDGADATQPERLTSGENIAELVGKLRPQFQLGLLGWIKDSSSELDLRRMANVASRLEAAADIDETYQLWWVVGGVLEALMVSGLDASIALKRLIGQADREIKRLQDIGEEGYRQAPPTELVNNLLYYVARSTEGGERCAAIRQAFNITGVAPGDEQVEEVRESLSAPSPKLMKTVADAIREDLAKAKDVLDIYVRTGMKDSTELETQVGLLRKISDTLGVLGLGPLREAVLARSQELDALASAAGEVQDAQLISLAASLLEIEGRLDGELTGASQPAEESTPLDVDPDFREVSGAVLRECIVNLAHVKEAVSQVSAQSDDPASMDSLDDQLRGISAGLTMLNKARAVDVLARVEQAIRRYVQHRHLGDEEQVNRLADSIVSLEYYMETLQAGRKEPEYMLENAESSLAVLEQGAPAGLAVDGEVDDSQTRTLRIDSAQMPEALQTASEQGGSGVDQTIVSRAPVLDTDEQQPDPELLEVFIEEAREEIAAIERHFPVWVANPVDEEALITVRRAFHTLKGSGRMVGAARIGEYSWSIENLLNRVISKTVSTDAPLVQFLTVAVAALPQLLEQLEAGADTEADLDGIAADAEVFAAGGVAERYHQDIEEPPVEDDMAETLVADEEMLAPEEPDPVLLDILTRETSGHLAVLRQFVADCGLDQSPYLVTEALHRACHTLHGSITMAKLAQAAVVTEPLYALVEHLYRGGQGLRADDLPLLAVAGDAIEQVIGWLASSENGSAPETITVAEQLAAAVATYTAEEAPQLEDEIIDIGAEPDGDASGDTAVDLDLGDSEESLVDVDLSLDAEPEPEPEPEPEAEAEAEAELEAEPEPEPEPGPELQPAGFDAEIAAIFVEEAAEILAESDAAIARLSENRSAAAPLAELQRHLHTLKGGARMAGITPMGDFSHELESLLIRINQGGIGLDDAAFSLLQSSVDDLHRMREDVDSGFVTPPAADLVAQLAGVAEATPEAPFADDDAEPDVEPVDSELIVGSEAEAEQEDISAGPDEEPPVLEDSPKEPPARRPRLPDTERLGELARELTSEEPPAEPTPLPEELAASAAPPAVPAASAEPAPRKDMARVDSAMLEDLLNNAGEISIFHSRLNQQVSSIQFNLVELGQTVHRLQQQLRLLEIETEAQILFKHQSEAAGDEEFDPLELDRYSKIQQLSRGLSETASDVSSIKDLLQNVAADTETILMQQARTTSELQDNLMRTRMVPFDHHVPRLSRLVRQQALETGKQVELTVEGSSGELDRQVMEKMLPPLEHMLRNAVVHGIETPEVRQQAGKAAVATITIRFRREGAQVLVDVVDDGAGLNLEGIHKKAIAQGVVRADQKLTEEETAELILRSGLSTADKLTQSAGRGIGMDVVVSEIAKLGGILAIKTQQGLGSTFTVRLPYTLAITQAFIVKVGTEVFALPLPSVEGVVRLSRQEFDAKLQSDEPAIEYGGRDYHLRHLGLYLGLGPATIAADEDQVALILVEAGENSAALIVDETADSREIVVKPIGPQLAAIRGIAGATILGDGRIVVILDPGSLVRAVTPGTVEVQPAPPEPDDLPPLALVVDDSITMRRVTQRLLERNGLRVVTAKDGVEALETMTDIRPEIIILDIEMPRMDGYEFAGHVRNNPATANLPIIMVTSRTGEKHRARAIELGVNDYLGKPYQESEMLSAITNLLGDRMETSQESMEHDTVS